MRITFAFVLGSLLILFGVVFLLDNFGYIDADLIFENFWPLVLILLGIAFLVRRPRGKEGDYASGAPSSSGSSGIAGPAFSQDRISVSEVFGGIVRKISSRNFTGGECSIVFGDITLDLTQIELGAGEQILRTSSVFGNVHLELPSQLEFSVRANHVAGRMDVNGARKGGLFQSLTYQSNGYTIAEKRLAIHASLVFGDVTIRQQL
jgi:predicted membrane protein